MKNTYLLIACMVISSICLAVAPTITSFLPVTAATGMAVTINGTNFTGATLVSFGGTAAASYTVVSAIKITAVIASGTSGAVRVTTPDGSITSAGFTYITPSTTALITDFGGYWASSTVNINSTIPDSSHNLLAFTFNGTTYSTGVNNAILDNKGIAYTAGNYKALPIAGITGSNTAPSTFLALASKVDGSSAVANTTAIADFSIRSVLTDGKNGLDLGTGVTNLPASAIMFFPIFNINTLMLGNSNPDILLTQIAQPSTGNDIFSFIDASGNTVGTTVTQNMTLLPAFGTYSLDLFTLTPATYYDKARTYSVNSVNTSREIRLTGFRLSDFNITISNVAQVKALKITPSSNSDYAFIGYNANAINLPPNISIDSSSTNTAICSGGTAKLGVLGAAAGGGSLSYTWQESTDGGSSWSPVAETGNYSGSATSVLSITNATNGYKYSATVMETGNGNPTTSNAFTITVSAPTAPSSVSISGDMTLCKNTPVQLTSSVTGGSNLFYQWQANTTGTYADIAGASGSTYLPPANQTGAISYRVVVASGSGCEGALTSTPAVVTVTGIATTTPAALCDSGPVTLSATATSGTMDWYAADAGGTSLVSASSFTTPVLNASKTYYVASSGCAAALRVPVTATIYPVSAGGSVSGSTTVITGTNSTTLTLAGNTGAVLKWQSSTDGFNTVIADIANTTTQLVANNLTQTTQYRTLIQSGTCASASSSPATITVNSTLPIHTNTVKAIKESGGVMVQWTSYNQDNTIRYEVERSADGVNFTREYAVLPEKNGNAAVTYTWLDTRAPTGTNFYRIKEIYLTGDYEFTIIVKLFIEKGNPRLSFSPNPVAGSVVQVQFIDMPAGEYRFTFVNSNGQAVNAGILTHSGGTDVLSMQIPVNVAKGVYRVSILGPGKSRQSYSLIILK